MKTLIYTVPGDGAHKTGEYEEFVVGRGTVRVIYYNENESALKRILKKRSLKKLTSGDAAICGK